MSKLSLSLMGLMAFAAVAFGAQEDSGTVIGIDLGTTYSW